MDSKTKESSSEESTTTTTTTTTTHSRMPAAALFESNSSVTDILREEALKSVVSIELNSLSGLTTSQDRTLLDSSSTAPVALPRPSTARRAASSTSGEFLQQMLATIAANSAGLKTATTSATMSHHTTPWSVANGGNGKLSSKAVQEMTESKNWNNLGSHEDINVAEVFKTQQEVAKTNTVASTTTNTKKKGKTDWGALMFQGLSAATAVAPPPPQPSSPPSLPPVTSAPREEIISSSIDVPVEAMARPTKKRGRSTTDGGTVDTVADAGIAAAATGTSKLPPNRTVPPNGNGNKVFYTPRDVDILLGRGGKANNHPGNKKYLELKDSMQDRYMAADKNEKTAISQELVDIVNKEWGGRFLRLDPLTNKYYEVDNVTARKKCSQTLREVNTAEVRAAKRAKYQR